MKEKDRTKKQLISERKRTEEKLRRAEAETRRRLKDQIALREAGAIITSTLDQAEVLNRIAHQMALAIDSTSAYISSFKQEGREFQVLAEYISPQACALERVSDLGAVYWDEDLDFAVKMESGRYDLAHISDLDLTEFERAQMKQYGAQSILYIPLHAKGQVIGVAEIWESRREREFTAEEIALCQGIAQQAAIAIENARLYEQTQQEITERVRAEEVLRQRNLELAMLNRAGHVLNSTLDLDQILGIVLEEVRLLLGVTTCSIWLLDPETGELVCQQATDPRSEILHGWRLPLGQGLAGWAARTGESLFVPDAQIDERHFKELDRLTGLTSRSVLAVPLIVKNNVIGALDVIDGSADCFDSTHLTLLEPLAASAAVAIENARLYEQTQQEITKRVRAEKALRESEEMHRNIVESNPVGMHMYQLEPDGRLVFIGANPAADEILRVDNSQFVGKTIEEAFPALIETEVPETYRRAASEGKAWHTDQIIYEEDQISGAFQVNAFQTSPGKMVATFLDITESKRAEEERLRLYEGLREQVELTQQIVDTVPDGVLLLDGRARVITANPAARDYLAVLANAKVGDALTRLSDRPIDELLTSPPQAGRWHEVKTDGPQSQTFEVIARPMEEGADARGFVLIIRDVTRERGFQKQVQQQERLAAVGQLAAGVAHDFNNIMASIILYSDIMLRTSDLAPRERERLEIIRQQGHAAADLTQQILDFGRKAILQRQGLNLVSFTEKLLQLLERTLPESIHIHLIYDDDEIMVNADPNRLQQAVMNLAINARDAMPEGGDLRIGLKQVRDQGARKRVRITVSDSGTGIPPDLLPRIFEPFFTTKAPLGSGLGLAQVYGIVKQHEGDINVESQVGHGTTFTIDLPALLTPQPQAPMQEIAAMAQGQGETILVVEDDAAVRQALVDSLQLLNYRTLEAENGQEALGIFEQHRGDPSALLRTGPSAPSAGHSPAALLRTGPAAPSAGHGIALVLSDLVMPEMGGKALLHALRQRDPAVRMIVLTGHPLQDGGKNLEAIGVAGWLRKPIDLDSLAQLVAQALKAS